MIGEDLSTKYTIIKLQRQDYIQKLMDYMQSSLQLKKSFCRFYLRGICIMKSEYCLFAHDFDQLVINHKEISQWNIITKTQCNQKESREARKKMFTEKTDFYQKPLFFIKQLDYNWLFSYQFSERYQKSKHPVLTLQEINKHEDARNRIRQIMHREQWDKVLNFIQTIYPDTDYTIDMISFWFAYLGFEKAQTQSKFRDFTKYLTNVKGYHELFIVVPPRTQRSLYLVKHNTYLFQHIQQAKKDNQAYRQQVKKIKIQRLKKIPQNLHKRFICRFYMAGNCLQSEKECLYVHNMAHHIFDKDIYFEKQYRQPPKSYEDRRNYVSLLSFYQANKQKGDKDITLEEINSNYQIKNSIRKRVHLQVYKEFLSKLQEIYSTKVFRLSLIQQQYERFGFNHTDQNKFGQQENYFQTLGYHKEEIENIQTRQKGVYVYKIPPIEELQQNFINKISKILKEQINTQAENGQKQILQSSIRRLIYSNTNKSEFQTPLHVYLRKEKITLPKLLQEYFPQYISYIFFETNEENFKKLIELLRKYFKKNKNFVYEMDMIESHIKEMHKEQININSLNNWKNLLELALLELDKHVYAWPVANSTLVIDRAHQSNFIQTKTKYPSIPLSPIIYEQLESKINSKIIKGNILVVNDAQTYEFCKFVLENGFTYGVDLQGNLSENGHIDLIQISCINGKKHIFILDIFQMLKNNDLKLLYSVKDFLKQIFQDEKRIKIFHACEHDCLALASIFKIFVKNVFDTSGTQIYFSQREIYRQMHANNMTYEHTLKKIKASRTMVGLNQVLQNWKAPNGPNQYKQLMKKHFSESPRSYFETRPLHQQFLNYSARDVQDLIYVYEEMTKRQEQLIWDKIGEMYSKARL